MYPKALIIEDNEDNQYLESLLLKQSGFSVITALDGREGIERARQALPDIIILDIQMPVMDGYETVACLKSDPVLRSIPVVGVSSYTLNVEREKALSLGFNGYIEKPIDPDSFVDEIRRFLPLREGDE
ncbi:MAG TPA: response regulator [Spirochaetota bacterium]|nr:response regulator [Spirochaetota bacterium]HPN12028.1 response regulator [Spirochaetota bacterium]